MEMVERRTGKVIVKYGERGCLYSGSLASSSENRTREPDTLQWVVRQRTDLFGGYYKKILKKNSKQTRRSQELKELSHGGCPAEIRFWEVRRQTVGRAYSFLIAGFLRANLRTPGTVSAHKSPTINGQSEERGGGGVKGTNCGSSQSPGFLS